MDLRAQLARIRVALTSIIAGPPMAEPDPPPPSRWLPDSWYWRNVVINVLVGVGVALTLRLAPEPDWLATRQDQAMDWMIRMHAGVSPEDYRGRPFVMLDIDETTYRRWGEPFHVPRDRLARLLSFALEGGAGLVLVDVDLDRAAGPEDAELVRVLQALPREPGGHPPVVLARSFREPLPPDSSPWREQRRSFLDPLVAAKPGAYWASTLFVRDPDYRVRRFRNVEPTCNDGEAAVTPAMQVLAAALLLDPEGGPARLREALGAYRPACGEADAPGGAALADRQIELGGVALALAGDRVSSRILFNFGGDRRPEATPPRVPFRSRETPLLTRLPAHRVTEGQQPLDASLVRDRVVAIGASYADSRDLHATPLGEMPGAVILLNAIYSLLQHGGLKPPSTAVVLATQIALVAVVSLAFAGINFIWAALIATPIVLAVLLPISFWLFHHGVWLDFAIPVGAVQIQAVIKKYIERYSIMRSRLNTLTAGASQEEPEPTCRGEEEDASAEQDPQPPSAAASAGGRDAAS